MTRPARRALLRSAAVCGGALALGAFSAPRMAEAADVFLLDGDAPLAMHQVADRGALAPGAVLEHVQMALIRPAPQQQELDALTEAQQTPGSARYHQWLSPHDLATRFAPPQAEIQKAQAWLTSQGLRVDGVAFDGMSISFSGTAARIGRAFRTELHDVVRPDGRHHIANVSAPSIPASLAEIVGGVTLSNFFPEPAVRPVGRVRQDARTGLAEIVEPAPGYTPSGSSSRIVTPADFAVIYDVPRAAGAIGEGQTVIVAEQTDIKPADWDTFRSTFGLSGYAGTLSIQHPGGCGAPGFTGDEGEAALDAEWASAVAPAANVILASCTAATSGFGVMTALQGIIANPPAAASISVSYGGCESGNGTSFQSMWNNIMQSLASEGYAVFVSSGDNAVAGCDNQNTASTASRGLAVNGLASTIYGTAVGGTDFSDTADGTTATYWSSTNSATFGSARSYIPEIPWDSSCASSVIWKYRGAKDALTYCNQVGNPFLNVVGGSGGVSAVYGKPTWQAGTGVPNDGRRDLPDVSLFSASGVWGHYYLFCMSDTANGGSACTSTSTSVSFSGAGGTSFAAPIMAGIQALIVQHKGSNQGNAAPRLYALAQTDPAAFHDVTRGDNAAPCAKGTANCYANTESVRRIGVLSRSTRTQTYAYPTTPGWDFATGLGSVDVANLVSGY